MERTLWSVDDTRRAFELAGFRTLHAGLQNQMIAASHALYVEQIRAKGDSVLLQLDTTDFDAGIAELLSVAVEVDPCAVEEPIDYLVFG